MRRTFLLAFCLTFGILWMGSVALAQATEQNQPAGQPFPVLAASPNTTSPNITSPSTTPSTTDAKPPLCRFGVNHVFGDITTVDTAALRVGWYINYTSVATPARPGGIDFAQVIRLYHTDTTTGYSSSPSSSELPAIVQNNLGNDWYIGNEPDRKGFGQDGILPATYARAYHDLYHLIKGIDPTARVIAGSIVQPTPVRLQYLDLILESYQKQFGVAMPVDGWAIHNFILNEVDCLSVGNDPNKCWGAEIPPGVSATVGITMSVTQNDDFTLFTQQIVRFRQWMAAHGYRNTPVYLSEYGVLMPAAFGFTQKRVNTFMSRSFDYILNTTDTAIGYPLDENRLVQRLSWYSTNDDGSFNGYLYQRVTSTTLQLTDMGRNYISYTQALSETVDATPISLYMTPQVYANDSQPKTVLLNAEIANSGNTLSQVVTVRFFNGNPTAGGVQIGSDRTVTLDGCGDKAIVQTQWTGPTELGTYTLYVQVDPANALAETNENNNTLSGTILVGSKQVLMPFTRR